MKFELKLGHNERITEQCKYQYKNEKGVTRLTQYILSGSDKQTVFINNASGICREIIRHDGTFAAFPGIESCDELTQAFEYPKIEGCINYGAYIVKLQSGRYLFLWVIQPHTSDPGDEWGFGMEEQPEIRLYSHIDENGRFTEPFRLYSICNTGFYEEPEENKVIFLDFDGVLNSKAYLENHNEYGVVIDPTRLDLLKKIVYETDAKIVLSTSWREHWNIIPLLCNETGKKINKIFSGAGLYIYDKTPDLNRNRYEEITAWLKSNSEVTKFVVLDDEPFEEGMLKGHFVLTSRLRNGLENYDAEKAINILSI